MLNLLTELKGKKKCEKATGSMDEEQSGETAWMKYEWQQGRGRGRG